MEPIEKKTKYSVATGNLMRCPLCGAVNSNGNAECFVCSWAGAFEHETVAIEEGLADMMGQCPELLETLELDPEPEMSRVQQFINRLFHRRIDIRI